MKRKYSQEEVWKHMTGRIYINKDDTNIFVRRKVPGSWTMNLGNRWSWVIIALEAIVLIGVTAILQVL
ncbi:MAG: hypothetical protein ATN34_00600 [Epulopiscium sp. Nele67-Bin002]|nr:MAG: hypothetical protein ATN34_00600 [Epulopiscium sp. Nele67-Bin002]OON91925.1 MAG: hypothetical protein ATN33_08290 [Epulopiscium sp. Nele67-Bin001]